MELAAEADGGRGARGGALGGGALAERVRHEAEDLRLAAHRDRLLEALAGGVHGDRLHDRRQVALQVGRGQRLERGARALRAHEGRLQLEEARPLRPRRLAGRPRRRRRPVRPRGVGSRGVAGPGLDADLRARGAVPSHETRPQVETASVSLTFDTNVPSVAVAPPIANTRAGFDVTRVAPPSGEAERAVTCSAGSDATSAQRASSPTRKTFPLLPVPTRTPPGVRTAACGTSSGELQRVSTSPEGRIRRRAPLGGPRRRLVRARGRGSGGRHDREALADRDLGHDAAGGGSGGGRRGRRRRSRGLRRLPVDGGGVEAPVGPEVEGLDLAEGRVDQDEGLPGGVDAVDDALGRAAGEDPPAPVEGEGEHVRLGRGENGLRLAVRRHPVDAALPARRDVEGALAVEGEGPDVLLGGVEEARGLARRVDGVNGAVGGRRRVDPPVRPHRHRVDLELLGVEEDGALRRPRSAARARRCRCRRRGRPRASRATHHAFGASGSKTFLGSAPSRSRPSESRERPDDLALEEGGGALEAPEPRPGRAERDGDGGGEEEEHGDAAEHGGLRASRFFSARRERRPAASR